MAVEKVQEHQNLTDAESDALQVFRDQFRNQNAANLDTWTMKTERVCALLVFIFLVNQRKAETISGLRFAVYSPRSPEMTLPIFHSRATACSASSFSASLLYST